MAIRHEDKGVVLESGNRVGTSDLLTFSPSYLLFFAPAFVYLWLVVEPNLIYCSFGTILPDAPQFAGGWAFLRDCAGMPGGLVAYASGWLSQGFCHAWLGAVVIVLAGFCIAELSRRHLARAGLRRASIPACLPAIALFLIYSQYKHPLTPCLAVSLGLLLSLAFERWALRQPLARIAACCLLAAAGFCIGGGGTLLVFVTLTAIWRFLAHRDWLATCIALPTGVAIAWLLAEYVVLIPGGQALAGLTPFSPVLMVGMDTPLKVLMCLLYGATPLAVLLVLIGRILLIRRKHKTKPVVKKTRAKDQHAPAQRKRAPLWAFAKAALSALPIALMALGLYLGHDDLRKPYVLSNCYCRQGQWGRIVDLNRRLPKDRNNPFVNHDLIRALYHTGRLPYDLFRYPQNPHALLLTHEQRESDLTQQKLCDIFLELGHVNMAEKLASELLATKSHFGPALERLGWISIIKGHADTARVYLNALRKDLIHRGTAESLLRGLDRGFTPEQAAYIDRIRSCMWEQTTAITGTEPVDETLAALLERNPHNKMAFEYLMACYLLTGQVDQIAKNIQRLVDFDYQGMPTLYEEAMLVYYGSRQMTVDLAETGIRPETFQRYLAFVRVQNTLQPHNQQEVLARLIRDFGSTYFFYYSFGRVGLQ
ncbi:MAG: hypothetical protein KBE65_06660 [Phycisphaerae bacterium]|nr:hypothetical protein [Phycisphaerae bacterium]